MRPTSKSASTGCPVEAALAVVGGLWKPLILFALLGGKKRFTEIGRLVPRATEKTLAVQLRELAADGLISRQARAQIPMRVDYELTQLGASLEPLLRALHDWGCEYLEERTGRGPS